MLKKRTVGKTPDHTERPSTGPIPVRQATVQDAERIDAALSSLLDSLVRAELETVKADDRKAAK
jgi:hypothetical protein